MKNEAQMQTLFNNWLAKTHWDWLPGDQVSAVFELKFVHTEKHKSIPFGNVQTHQMRGLRLATKALIYKIPDGFAGGKKPFDSFIIREASAYVVLMFYKPRKPKEFILIDIYDFTEAKKTSKRKSLTEEMAKAIGKVYKVK